MTRILHTGDTHLGYQQYHLPARREDFLTAFQRVASDAQADDVDAVVHAGDLFHDRQPTLSDIMGALSVLRDLDDAGIPFLAIVGNHESKRREQWLDLFETMGLATRLGNEPVVVGDVAVYGLDFIPQSQRESYDYEFEPHDTEYAALVSHGLFEPFEHGNWDTRRLLQEADVRFDVLLLGDDHTPETKRLETPYETWLTYCGSTERASASEREDRGYNLVTFDSGVDIRRRGLDTRTFVFIDIELGVGEGSGRIRERIDEYDVEESVVIVTITGDGETVTPAGIEEYAAEQGALVTRVNDRRELTEESEIEVSFADPDEVVQQRIQELGLSTAARELDETIRSSKVADTNVSETVERRVRELVADADSEAFERVGGDGAVEESEQTDNETTDKSKQTDNETTDESEQHTREEQTTVDEDETADHEGESQVTMEDYL